MRHMLFLLFVLGTCPWCCPWCCATLHVYAIQHKFEVSPPKNVLLKAIHKSVKISTLNASDKNTATMRCVLGVLHLYDTYAI